MATKKKVGYAAYRLSPLKQITSAAQAMRKKQPSMPWKTAVAKASAQYNNGTIKKTASKSAPKKKAAVRKVVVRKVKAKKTAKKKTSAAVKQGALFGRVGNRSMEALDNISRLQRQLIDAEKNYLRVYGEWKKAKLRTEKIYWRSAVDCDKKYIQSLKKQIQEMKKHIK